MRLTVQFDYPKTTKKEKKVWKYDKEIKSLIGKWFVADDRIGKVIGVEHPRNSNCAMAQLQYIGVSSESLNKGRRLIDNPVLSDEFVCVYTDYSKLMTEYTECECMQDKLEEFMTETISKFKAICMLAKTTKTGK